MASGDSHPGNLCQYFYFGEITVEVLYFERYLISQNLPGGQICENKSLAKFDNHHQPKNFDSQK